MTHAISWFEIPAEDLDRAERFYETVLDRELRDAEDTDEPYLTFETAAGEIGGGLFEADDHDFESGESLSFATGEAGPLVYLTISGDVADAVDRVGPAGGAVLVGPTTVSDTVEYAIVRDTEGNRVGLMTTE